MGRIYKIHYTVCCFLLFTRYTNHKVVVTFFHSVIECDFCLTKFKVGICNLHIFYRKPYLLSKLSSFFVRLRCCQYLYLIWHNQVNLVFLCLKIKTLNNLHAYKQREFYINKNFLMIFHLSSKFHIIRNVIFSDGSGSRNWIFRYQKSVKKWVFKDKWNKDFLDILGQMVDDFSKFHYRKS